MPTTALHTHAALFVAARTSRATHPQRIQQKLLRSFCLGALRPRRRCSHAESARFGAQEFHRFQQHAPPRSAAEVRCGPRQALATPAQTTVCREVSSVRSSSLARGLLYKLRFSTRRRSSRPASHAPPRPTRVRRNCCRPYRSRRSQIASHCYRTPGRQPACPGRQQLRLGALPALRRRCSHPAHKPKIVVNIASPFVLSAQQQRDGSYGP